MFHKRHTNGQQVYEKVLNIIVCKEDVNKNHSDLSCHTCQNVYYQKLKKNTPKYNKCQQGYREIGRLLHYWLECKRVQSYENSIVFTQKIKTLNYHMTQKCHCRYIYIQSLKGQQYVYTFPYSLQHCSHSQDMKATYVPIDK